MTTNTKEYGKQWYENNKEARLVQIKANKVRVRKLITEYKSTLKCERCGYDAHPVALDFHHKNPNEKEFQIGTAINRGYGWDRIKAEIDKCEVVCANCHRIEHCRYEI